MLRALNLTGWRNRPSLRLGVNGSAIYPRFDWLIRWFAGNKDLIAREGLAPNDDLSMKLIYKNLIGHESRSISAASDLIAATRERRLMAVIGSSYPLLPPRPSPYLAKRLRSDTATAYSLNVLGHSSCAIRKY